MCQDGKRLPSSVSVCIIWQKIRWGWTVYGWTDIWYWIYRMSSTGSSGYSPLSLFTYAWCKAFTKSFDERQMIDWEMWNLIQSVWPIHLLSADANKLINSSICWMICFRKIPTKTNGVASFWCNSNRQIRSVRTTEEGGGGSWQAIWNQATAKTTRFDHTKPHQCRRKSIDIWHQFSHLDIYYEEYFKLYAHIHFVPLAQFTSDSGCRFASLLSSLATLQQISLTLPWYTHKSMQKYAPLRFIFRLHILCVPRSIGLQILQIVKLQQRFCFAIKIFVYFTPNRINVCLVFSYFLKVNKCEQHPIERKLWQQQNAKKRKKEIWRWSEWTDCMQMGNSLKECSRLHREEDEEPKKKNVKCRKKFQHVDGTILKTETKRNTI